MGQALLINALFFINQSLAYNVTLLVRVLHSVDNYLSLFWFWLSFFSFFLLTSIYFLVFTPARDISPLAAFDLIAFIPDVKSIVSWLFRTS